MSFKFDNSLLSDGAKCDAMAIAKHVHGRQRKGGGDYGDFGNVVHKVMEHHFSGGSEPGSMGIFEGEYAKLVPEGESPAKVEFEFENMRKIVGQFIRTHPVERFPFTVIETEKIVGVELEPGYEFYMKRDALVLEKAAGMECPLDHKTRWGQITEWWTKKFRMSSQFSGYIWGSRAINGGMGNKIYINAMSMAKLPDSNRKCKKHGMPFHECQLEHCDFQLLIYNRTEEQIAAWKRDAIALARRLEGTFKAFGDVNILKYASRQGTFNESCTFCDFQEWCKADFDPAMMDELTEYKPWRPWESVEDGEATSDKGYVWLYDREKEMIWPSAKLVSGMKVIPAKMALAKLWQMGKERWMEVWGMKLAQGEMAEFARGKSNKGDN